MKRPAAVHPWADEILRALARYPESKEIVLGGYFALQHYLDYRRTHDIDAWWRGRAQPSTLQAIRSVMKEFGERHGCTLAERQFGETYSFELVQNRPSRRCCSIWLRWRRGVRWSRLPTHARGRKAPSGGSGSSTSFLGASVPYIDHSVYPDRERLPEELLTDEAKADYVHRVCSAWDFHIPPEPETFSLFSGWKEVFDRYPLPLSPGYHAFRMWFGWETVPIPRGLCGPSPVYAALDRRGGRASDPCEGLV